MENENIFAAMIPTNFSISSKIEKSIWNMIANSPTTIKIDTIDETNAKIENSLGLSAIYQNHISLSKNPPQFPSLNLFNSECIL